MEAREIDARYGGKSLDTFVAERGAKCFDPRCDRQDILALPATPQQDLSAAALSARGEFIDKTTLSDPSFANDERELTLAAVRALPDTVEPLQVGLSSDEG